MTRINGHKHEEADMGHDDMDDHHPLLHSHSDQIKQRRTNGSSSASASPRSDSTNGTTAAFASTSSMNGSMAPSVAPAFSPLDSSTSAPCLSSTPSCPSSHSTSSKTRRILRVTHRPSSGGWCDPSMYGCASALPTSWRVEAVQLWRKLFGTRGRQNPWYHVKVVTTFGMVLALVLVLALRPPRSHTIDPFDEINRGNGASHVDTDGMYAAEETSNGGDGGPLFYSSEGRVIDDGQALPAGLANNPFSAQDVTFFTFHSPTAEEIADAQTLRTSNDLYSPARHVHLRAMYSWSLCLPEHEHGGADETSSALSKNILVFVHSVDDCLVFRSFPQVTCRVTTCYDEYFGATRVPCLFEEAASSASTELLVYVDEHVILFEDFLPSLLLLSQRLPVERFMLLGQSRPLDLRLDTSLDYASWHRDLESAVFVDSSGQEAGLDLLDVDRIDTAAAAATTTSAQDQQPSSSLHSMHYIAFHRDALINSKLPCGLVMHPSGQLFGNYSWMNVFVASMLVHDDIQVVDGSSSIHAIWMEDHGHGVSNATLFHPDDLPADWMLPCPSSSSPASPSLIESDELLPDLQSSSSSESPGHSSPPLDMLATSFHLGRLENAHYALMGACPSCRLRENREGDLGLILLRRANSQRQVIVMAVNAEYLALAFNWICRARILGLRNYVLLAEDRVAYRVLRKFDEPVVLRKDALYRKQASSIVTGSATSLREEDEASSKGFQETLYLRALFIREVVNLGFDLILTHLDTIWFEDPLPMLAASASSCDMWVQQEKGGGSRVGGGLVSIRSNEVGRSFAEDYLSCERQNWKFIQVHGKPRFSYSDDVDIDCIELISTRLIRRNSLQRCTFDPATFVSETTFFDEQRPQRSGEWPSFVHLNTARGVTNKTRAFTSWHLWSVDDEKMLDLPDMHQPHTHATLKCQEKLPTIPRPNDESMNKIRIQIQLLGGVEYESLELTLLSLASALYPSDGSILLDLSVTLQPSTPSSSTATQPDSASSSDKSSANDLERSRQTVEHFRWKFGRKSLVVAEEFIGATDKWVDLWEISADSSSFLLVLEAGQVLSPHWLTWIHEAIQRYYFDPFSYDPQLTGISLVHELLILGETPSARFGSRIPSQVLLRHAEKLGADFTREEEERALDAAERNVTFVPRTPPKVYTHLYLYQMVHFTGMLFFPRHFNTFLQWYSDQDLEERRTPCIPTLISNAWYLEDSTKHWWAWMNRFVFEAGWYALYTNFHTPEIEGVGVEAQAIATDGTPEKTASPKLLPRALLVDDDPSVGSLGVHLLKSLPPQSLFFPPRSNLLLMDFHFRVFDLKPWMLGRRKFLFPPLPGSTSMRLALDREAEMYSLGELGTGVGGTTNEHIHAPHMRLTGTLAQQRREDRRRAWEYSQREHEEFLEDHEGLQQHDLEVAEEDISHLDVMIEGMIRVMENDRQRGASSNSHSPHGRMIEEMSTDEHDDNKPSLDELRAMAAARSEQQRRLSHPEHRHLFAHHAHHPRPIRGRHHDRCYIVQSSEDVATTTSEITNDNTNTNTDGKKKKKKSDDGFQLHPTLKIAIRRRAMAEAAEKAGPDPEKQRAASHAVALAKGKADPLYPYYGANFAPEELYRLMWEMASPNLPQNGANWTEISGVRFVLYQPTKMAPFDRHLRGLYFTFLVSLLSNRIMLVDLPDLERMYECPFGEGITWNWKAVKDQLQHARMDYFDNVKTADLRIGGLDQLYTKPLIIHTEPVTHDRILFKNNMYKHFPKAIFGTKSRMRRTGEVIKLLLSKPRPELVEAAKELQAELGLDLHPPSSSSSNNQHQPPRTSISLHVVIPSPAISKPFDPRDPLPMVPGRFWDCTRSFLLSLNLIAEHTRIVFSSNRMSEEALEVVRNEVGSFGSIVANKKTFVNLNTTNVNNPTDGGVSNCNTTSLILSQDGSTILHIDPAIVSGFVFGTTNISISTGTTYGIFSAARTGFKHRAFIVKLAPKPKFKAGQASSEEDYCGPMHRLDLAPAEDIQF